MSIFSFPIPTPTKEIPKLFAVIPNFEYRFRWLSRLPVLFYVSTHKVREPCGCRLMNFVGVGSKGGKVRALRGCGIRVIG